jgi:alpha-beta hydrolase superfamily lysophospholipase
MGREKCVYPSVAIRPVGPGSGPDTLITADGCTLHRREWSTRSARATVVLVHGFTASTDDVAVVRQAEALQDEGFHVVSYDSRGHGRSGGVCTLGDRESYDVAAAVEWAKLGGRRVIVVGASMGAVAALRYAASGDAQLAGVIAISAPATWRTPPSPGAMFLFALTRTAIGWQYTTRHLGIRMAPTWVAPPPATELVRHLDVPVAIIHGHRDRYIRVKDAETIYRACRSPRKRLDLVRGMGHAFDKRAIPSVTAAAAWLLDA